MRWLHHHRIIEFRQHHETVARLPILQAEHSGTTTRPGLSRRSNPVATK
jgi:hypothetical protein